MLSHPNRQRSIREVSPSHAPLPPLTSLSAHLPRPPPSPDFSLTPSSLIRAPSKASCRSSRTLIPPTFKLPNTLPIEILAPFAFTLQLLPIHKEPKKLSLPFRIAHDSRPHFARLPTSFPIRRIRSLQLADWTARRLLSLFRALRRRALFIINASRICLSSSLLTENRKDRFHIRH